MTSRTDERPLGRTVVRAIVQDAGQWIVCTDPVRVVAADRQNDVKAALAEVERLTRDKNLHAVGWVSYEAAEAFGLAVRPEAAPLPLVWFALFDHASIRRVERLEPAGPYVLGRVSPAIDRAAFGRAFAVIRERIAAGDTYQANFTFPMTAPFEGDPEGLFQDLVEAQRGAYSAFIVTETVAICSASPELFFELDGLDVRTRPMKGTARRGLTPSDDQATRHGLVNSVKERAENVMIVDMMRNDLGRIAELGSITVPALFEAERYPTVWQMTSTVTARSTASLADIFAALHPSASVTGAPKIRTMELLKDLERAPRGIYTGAIGQVEPNGNARFNVAIRTAVVDMAGRSVHFGIGSGIVWDSDPDAEYDECLLKGAVLGRRPTSFELLETLRWSDDDGFFLLDRHLERLAGSAEYLDIACSIESVRAALDSAVAAAVGRRRVRVLMARDGGVRVEHQPLGPSEALRVAVSASPVARGNVWLYHKTTHRTIYDDARKAAPEVDDVLLWNERGEVTESTVANIVAEIGGVRVTPPIECGLLAGTFRAELLARGEIRERIIRVDEIREVPLWLVNSVHEWRRAEIV